MEEIFPSGKINIVNINSPVLVWGGEMQIPILNIPGAFGAQVPKGNN